MVDPKITLARDGHTIGDPNCQFCADNMKESSAMYADKHFPEGCSFCMGLIHLEYDNPWGDDYFTFCCENCGYENSITLMDEFAIHGI